MVQAGSPFSSGMVRQSSPFSLGIAALPTILIIGGIIMEIAITSGVLALLNASNSLNVRSAAEALYAARSGANDGLIKVVRDKNFNSAGYVVSINTMTATVIVTKDQPAQGQTKIVSTSDVLSRRKVYQVIVSVDSVSGETNLISSGEI